MYFRGALRLLVLCLLLTGCCFGPSRAAVTCVIRSTAVKFGKYDVFNVANTDSNGSITYHCNGYLSPPGSGPITIFLNKGTSLTFTPRFMHTGVNHLNYNLYLDAAHTQVCGTTTPACGSTKSDPALALGGTVTDTVYALLPKAQNAVASVTPYTDSLTVTINF